MSGHIFRAKPVWRLCSSGSESECGWKKVVLVHTHHTPSPPPTAHQPLDNRYTFYPCTSPKSFKPTNIYKRTSFVKCRLTSILWTFLRDFFCEFEGDFNFLVHYKLKFLWILLYSIELIFFSESFRPAVILHILHNFILCSGEKNRLYLLVYNFTR